MTQRPLQTDDLLRFRLATDLQLAPAGDRIAFVLRSVNAEKNSYDTCLYLGATNGNPAVRFTGGESDSRPRFAPDGRTLAFLSKRSGQSQIWLISLAGGEARQLTRIQGGIAEFAWSPDGGSIAFLARLKPGEGIRPEVKEDEEKDLFEKYNKDVKVITEFNHREDGVGFFDERRPQIGVVAVAEGAEPRLLTDGPYHRSELCFSADGQWLFYLSHEGEDYDHWDAHTEIYAQPVAGGAVSQVTRGEYSYRQLAITPDGQWLVALGNAEVWLGYDNPRPFLVPADPAQWPVAAGRDLCEAYDRPFACEMIDDMVGHGGGPLVVSPDSRYLYSGVSSGGNGILVRVELSSGAVQELLTGERVIYSHGLDAACGRVAFAYTQALDPCTVAWASLPPGGDASRPGEEQVVLRPNAELLADLQIAEPVRFTACAGPGEPAVDAWLLKPPHWQPDKQYPAILEIHGGPMGMYASAFFFEFQWLAARGYTVMYANPRLSMGYGRDFCAGIRNNWGSGDYADVMAVVDQALADNPWLDANRLGAAGGSYGGFMVNWIVTHTQRFRAAVTMRSVVDWRLMAASGDSGAYWYKRAGGVPYWRDDSVYKQQSPITYIENVVTPLLIEHQEGDLRCPVDQAEGLFTALKYLGKAPVKLVRYPGEFHGMSRDGKPWHRIHRLRLIAEWFEQYIAAEPAAEPAGAADAPAQL